MATGAKLPTMNGTNPGRVKFGPFEADLYTHEIWKHGVKIKLVGQPFEVLAILLNRPGELVTREELHDRLWPGDTFVDFDHGLNAAVNRLREALSDSVEAPRYVETLPRRGYRFIAAVESAGNAARPKPQAKIPNAPSEESREDYPALRPGFGLDEFRKDAPERHSRRRIYLIAAGVIAGLVFGSLFLHKIVSSSVDPRKVEAELR